MNPYDTSRRDALDAAVAIAKINGEPVTADQLVTDAKLLLGFLVPSTEIA